MSELQRIDVAQVVREATGAGAAKPNLVTRPLGEKVRAALESRLQTGGAGRYQLDFSGVEFIDYSGADEAVAKIIGRIQNNEYGDVFIVLTGLESHQVENLEAALRERKLPAMVVGTDGSWKIIGMLNNYLQETLAVVMEKSTSTAKELSDKLGISLKTGSTRLINLHKTRMVWRQEEGMEAGGRQFLYHSLLLQTASAQPF